MRDGHARLVVVGLLLLGLALVAHLTLVGHGEMSMIGTCLAVLQPLLVGLILVATAARSAGFSAPALVARSATPALPPPTGRCPPDDGTVLRR